METYAWTKECPIFYIMNNCPNSEARKRRLSFSEGFAYASREESDDVNDIPALVILPSKFGEDHHHYQAWFSAICDKESTIGMDTASQYIQK